MSRVGPGEIAILTSVLHPENDLRVCQVIAQLDDESGYSETVWWLCEFTRPVKTFLGWMHFACIPDNDLSCIGLRCERYRYPPTHYQFLPQLAEALRLTRSYREACA
jgi:hypothetical protein